MIVVSDSSPLIALAKIDCFSLLKELFGRLSISAEVYDEVVIAGVGLAGSAEVSTSSWIEMHKIQNIPDLTSAQDKTGLGLGELSSILLAGDSCGLGNSG